ncbi:Phosphoglycerate mutase [Haliangium ochraceum DSM 14365]|uniref:Phosphoglycerate mutase n=1 Tax=Haliangium ochraceum (strain DSM 14365 / JCM 11303 / SMP-2) TaxID=502025 RepID=D0LIW1_HALO1|nr:Phosphoglycerate mutase [Haliangium ochraceum DSM 14365]
MELIFVRHAEPAWVSGGQSNLDPPLTALGQVQARLTASAFRQRETPSEILVSPRVRARETAAPIAEALALAPCEVPFFEEIRLPDWSNTPADEVSRTLREARARPMDTWWDGLPGGESFRDFHERITGGLRALLAGRGARRVSDERHAVWEFEDREQRLLFVGHGGSNAVALTFLLDLQPVPWEWERFVSQHASITVVRSRRIATGHIFALRSFSAVDHLPLDMRST